MRIPIPAMIIGILLSVAVDLYIWRDIRSGKSLRRWKWSEVYAVSSILLWIYFIVTICLPRRGLDGGVYIVMWMLTAYASVYISKIIYCIISLAGRIPLVFRCRRWGFTRYVGIIVSVASFAYIWYGILVTTRQTQTISLTLESSKLPKGFDGYRIAQISDLHLGTWGQDTVFISKFVDQINALNPDLVVFTGDIVNQKTDEIKPFVKVLSRLSAKDGVYSILGNHDYGDYVDWPSAEAKVRNLENLKVCQNKAGWKMLNNEHVFIRRSSGSHTDSIALIGVENWGEPPFGQYGDLAEAYPKKGKNHFKDDNFKILLTHNPEHWIRQVRYVTNIDLSLSGHTHAMQMSADAFGRRWSPSAWRYSTWGGFYTEDMAKNIIDFGNPSASELKRDIDRSSLYVNIGAGEVGMPYRLGTSAPEITLITLRKK